MLDVLVLENFAYFSAEAEEEEHEPILHLLCTCPPLDHRKKRPGCLLHIRPGRTVMHGYWQPKSFHRKLRDHNRSVCGLHS